MTIRRGWRHIAAILLAASLVAAACSDDDSSDAEARSETSGVDPTTERAPAEPQSGGTLRFITNIETQTLDPLQLGNQATGSFLHQGYAIFGALVTQARGEDEVEPGIAESVTSSDGGTTWIVKLRPGVSFSDGTPYNAEAVVAHWARIADPANRSRALPAMLDVKSYTATDDVTVTVTLSAPNTMFDRTMAGSALSYVPSPTAVAEKGPDFGSAPVGAGPFVLTEWQRNSQMVLGRNPTYWDAPRPYIDELIFRPLPDEGQALNSFKAGEADLYFTINKRDAESVEDGNTLYVAEQLSGSGIQFNMTKPPFDDASMRKAVSLALDVAQINEVVYSQDNPPRSIFMEDTAFFTEDALYPERDVEAAKGLVDAYKQRTGSSDLTIPFLVINAPSQLNLAQLIQAQLGDIGIKVELQPVDSATLVAGLRSKDYNFTTGGLLGTYPDPALYTAYHSSGFGNYSGYSNATVDKALENARATQDADEQAEFFQEASVQIAKDIPYRATRFSTYYLVGRPNVMDITTFEDVALRSDLIWLEP